MRTKEEILQPLFNAINNAQSDLIISSKNPKELNDMVQAAYDVLETAKMGLRGVYHTEKF